MDMALRAKILYQIEGIQDISKERILGLFTCYQACIGHNAISFYLTLLSESRIQAAQREHTRLCRLTSMDIRQMDAARIRCEQYSLIKTYMNEEETMVFYELQMPLSAREFLLHDVFGRLYLSRMGMKDTGLTSSSVLSAKQPKRPMKDISAPFDASLISLWDQEKEVEYSKVTQEKEVVIPVKHGFDTEQFLSETSSLIFPYQARTQENLELISDLGALYGISEDRMRILVGHCVNNASNSLNQDMLKRMASYEKPEIKHEPKNRYDIPPVLFLENIQGGVSVTQVDKRLLEYLALQMHFSQEVINVLIEYVLKINENKLVRSFVESVASSWLRSNVATVEDALRMTEMKPQSKTVKKPVRKAALPEYMTAKKETSAMSEEERSQLMNQLNQLEE